MTRRFDGSDDYMLDKVLDNFKNIIDIEKFDDTKISINANVN